MKWIVDIKGEIEGDYELIGKYEEIPKGERQKGEWIGGELGNCSVCGHYGCASDIWDRCKGKYCPNCGADLRGGEYER